VVCICVLFIYLYQFWSCLILVRDLFRMLLIPHLILFSITYCWRDQHFSRHVDDCLTEINPCSRYIIDWFSFLGMISINVSSIKMALILFLSLVLSFDIRIFYCHMSKSVTHYDLLNLTVLNITTCICWLIHDYLPLQVHHLWCPDLQLNLQDLVEAFPHFHWGLMTLSSTGISLQWVEL